MTTILRMTKRSRNGPRSRKYHAVPPAGYAGRTALCGARPNIGAVSPAGKITGAKGWGARSGKAVTCPRCVAALRRRS